MLAYIAMVIVFLSLCGCNHSRGIWDWLWFSCGVAHSRGGLGTIFRGGFPSVGGVLILAGGLGGELLFCGI